MNKSVKCPSCGEVYNLDLDKYGGKKIRCKKCQTPIAVPTVAETADEFEVVEEASQPAHLPVPPTSPSHVPPSILNRQRTASQRGTVNIALLQRNEPSREHIRQAFLSVHGTEQSRSSPIEAVMQEIGAGESSIAQFQEKLNWLKDVLARALASDPQSTGESLTKPVSALSNFLTHRPGGLGALVQQLGKGNTQQLHKENDEKAYSHALQIVGRPVGEIPQEKQLTGLGRITADLTGQRQRDRDAKVTATRAIKINTIKAAIEMGQALLEERQESESEKRESLHQQMDLFLRSHQTALDKARSQLSSGNLAEATSILQESLRTAPVGMLGQVLVALSECTYLSGNASNAARHIQDAICFGASAPVNVESGYHDLWAKASAGLPKT